MPQGSVRELPAMLAQMAPRLDTVLYRFTLVTPDIAQQLLGGAVATFREAEGVTAIVPAALAEELQQSGPDFARIILEVRSDLQGVGLTAAVTTALAQEGIACNCVAAFHHDHLFVPADRREEVLRTLENLSQGVGRVG